jgi:hypothetical protein
MTVGNDVHSYEQPSGLDLAWLPLAITAVATLSSINVSVAVIHSLKIALDTECSFDPGSIVIFLVARQAPDAYERATSLRRAQPTMGAR